MKRVWRLAAPAAIALTLGAPPAAALGAPAPAAAAWPATGDAPSDATGAVRGISVVPASGRAEVVIAVEGTVTIRDFAVESPFRVVIDLRGARLGMPTDAYDRVSRGGVRNVRLSQFDASTVRVVVDLDGRRDYSVVNVDGAIRVAINGGDDFTAWSSDGDLPETVVAVATVGAVAVGMPGADQPFADDAPIRQQQAVRPVKPVVVAAPVQPQQRRITVNYEDADIRDVLAAFAAFSGRTIVTGRDVEGKVTAEIRNQPWDVALDALLNAQQLAKTEDPSGIITVDSYSNILLRQSSEPIVTRLVSVNYANAASLSESVRALLSRDCRAARAAATEPGQVTAGGSDQQCPARGQATADSATNTLLISEVPSRMAELLSYVKALDVRTKQVSIKGKLISVNRSATEQLGLSYDLGSTQGFSNRLAPRLDDDGKTIPGEFVVQLGGNALVGVANANRLYGQSSALSLIFSTVLGKFSLTSFLDALSEERLSDVQAEPTTTTMDNKKARLLVGQETPVRTVDYGSATTPGQAPRATVQFRETGIILEVTPHITNNRQILMDVYAEQSELQIVGGDLGFFLPKRNVKTQVIVRDGETMAIGGLTQTQVTKIRSGIPILSKLPLLGRLFSQTETREDKQDLLILLTPHILDEGPGGGN
ncbi:MAG: AMIN domain-containing protein [Gemmatimonadaceae bacterium]